MYWPKVANCIFILLLQIILQCNSLNVITHNKDRPGKNLCRNEDVDCSNQVHNGVSQATCLMKFLLKNSAECSDSAFDGERGTTEEYGSVDLAPFPWIDDDGFIYPSLNITFTNIKWHRLRMRFIKVGKSTPQNCREFILTGDIDSSHIISYDCLWHNGTIGGEHYRFQYLLTTKDGRRLQYNYLLRIPKDNEVRYAVPDHQLFLLMDYSAFPHITLKLQVPPSSYNVTSTNITLFYKEDVNSSITELQAWKVNLTYRQEGDFVRIEPFVTDYTPGYYYFNASFSNDYCRNNCIESSTPQLHIKGSRHSLQVVIAVIFITLSMIGLIGYLMWKNKQKKIINNVKKTQNVLFVYESNYPSHIENIYKFKEFLEDNCFVVPKMDLIDIPKTESMNPWAWYYQAFEEADYVLVFASPSGSIEKGLHEDNVYHNLHSYALKLLIVYLMNRHKFVEACVKLPGCSWDTLPPEARIINKKFSLPERLGKMLQFLKVPPLKNESSMLITALQQPRNAPQLCVSKPVAPLRLPFDAGSFNLDEDDDDGQEPVSVGGVFLNLGGQPSSEDDEDEEEEDEGYQYLAAFKL